MEESEDTLGCLEPGEDLASHNIPSIELYLPSVCVCVFVKLYVHVLAAIQGAVN